MYVFVPFQDLPTLTVPHSCPPNRDQLRDGHRRVRERPVPLRRVRGPRGRLPVQLRARDHDRPFCQCQFVLSVVNLLYTF